MGNASSIPTPTMEANQVGAKHRHNCMPNVSFLKPSNRTARPQSQAQQRPNRTGQQQQHPPKPQQRLPPTLTATAPFQIISPASDVSNPSNFNHSRHRTQQTTVRDRRRASRIYHLTQPAVTRHYQPRMMRVVPSKPHPSSEIIINNINNNAVTIQSNQNSSIAPPHHFVMAPQNTTKNSRTVRIHQQPNRLPKRNSKPDLSQEHKDVPELRQHHKVPAMSSHEMVTSPLEMDNNIGQPEPIPPNTSGIIRRPVDTLIPTVVEWSSSGNGLEDKSPDQPTQRLPIEHPFARIIESFEHESIAEAESTGGSPNSIMKSPVALLFADDVVHDESILDAKMTMAKSIEKLQSARAESFRDVQYTQLVPENNLNLNHEISDMNENTFKLGTSRQDSHSIWLQAVYDIQASYRQQSLLPHRLTKQNLDQASNPVATDACVLKTSTQMIHNGEGRLSQDSTNSNTTSSTAATGPNLIAHAALVENVQRQIDAQLKNGVNNKAISIVAPTQVSSKSSIGKCDGIQEKPTSMHLTNETLTSNHMESRGRSRISRSCDHQLREPHLQLRSEEGRKSNNTTKSGAMETEDEEGSSIVARRRKFFESQLVRPPQISRMTRPASMPPSPTPRKLLKSKLEADAVRGRSSSLPPAASKTRRFSSTTTSSYPITNTEESFPVLLKLAGWKPPSDEIVTTTTTLQPKESVIANNGQENQQPMPIPGLLRLSSSWNTSKVVDAPTLEGQEKGNLSGFRLSISQSQPKKSRESDPLPRSQSRLSYMAVKSRKSEPTMNTKSVFCAAPKSVSTHSIAVQTSPHPEPHPETRLSMIASSDTSKQQQSHEIQSYTRFPANSITSNHLTIAHMLAQTFPLARASSEDDEFGDFRDESKQRHTSSVDDLAKYMQYTYVAPLTKKSPMPSTLPFAFQESSPALSCATASSTTSPQQPVVSDEASSNASFLFSGRFDSQYPHAQQTRISKPYLRINTFDSLHRVSGLTTKETPRHGKKVVQELTTIPPVQQTTISQNSGITTLEKSSDTDQGFRHVRFTDSTLKRDSFFSSGQHKSEMTVSTHPSIENKLSDLTDTHLHASSSWDSATASTQLESCSNKSIVEGVPAAMSCASKDDNGVIPYRFSLTSLSRLESPKQITSSPLLRFKEARSKFTSSKEPPLRRASPSVKRKQVTRGIPGYGNLVLGGHVNQKIAAIEASSNQARKSFDLPITITHSKASRRFSTDQQQQGVSTLTMATSSLNSESDSSRKYQLHRISSSESTSVGSFLGELRNAQAKIKDSLDHDHSTAFKGSSLGETSPAVSDGTSSTAESEGEDVFASLLNNPVGAGDDFDDEDEDDTVSTVVIPKLTTTISSGPYSTSARSSFGDTTSSSVSTFNRNRSSIVSADDSVNDHFVSLKFHGESLVRPTETKSLRNSCQAPMQPRKWREYAAEAQALNGKSNMQLKKKVLSERHPNLGGQSLR